jgi:sigma-B regulation protein RsbU (phosphoserine phosphatase)
MTVNIIGTAVLLLVVLGVIVSIIGLVNYTDAFKKEYTTTTYHMADTAAMLVNGNHLEDYLAGRNTEEYERTKNYLDTYCKKISVSLVYVIVVDQSDYGRFVSVFNAVDNSVDDTNYTPWELGFKRDTTNDEYRQKYKRLYDKESLYETLFRINTTDGQHPHITTLVPVRNTSGKVTGILCMQRPTREIADARRPYIINVAAWTLALSVIAGVVFSLFLRRRIMRPIRRVSEETTRFAKENTKGETLSGVSSIKEIHDMALSVDTLETDMVNYIDNLTVATAEKERIGTELSLATTIQVNSIPNVFPAFPEREDFDIHASMTPAKAVGGDFYNFYMIDDTRLGMVIGDVSGKGIPAALFMMRGKAILRDCMLNSENTGTALSGANRRLYEGNETGTFITAWMGLLNPDSGELTFSNAGHNPPVLIRNGRACFLPLNQNLILGAVGDSEYVSQPMKLKKGDVLFLYTDGVTEALNRAGELFGESRLLRLLSEPLPEEEDVCKKTCRRVCEAVDAFAEGTPQADDITMLCLQYPGSAV